MHDELILTWYGHADDSHEKSLTPMTATEVAESLVRNVDNRIVVAIGAALKKCGYVSKSVRANGVALKRYMMPPKRF